MIPNWRDKNTFRLSVTPKEDAPKKVPSIMSIGMKAIRQKILENTVSLAYFDTVIFPGS